MPGADDQDHFLVKEGLNLDVSVPCWVECDAHVQITTDKQAESPRESWRLFGLSQAATVVA